MENVQFCVVFWTPTTSHMAAASWCQCRGFISKKLYPKKEVSHCSHCAVYFIFVYMHKCCWLTYKHWLCWCLLNRLLCWWTLSSLIFFLCRSRTFPFKLEIGGIFDLVSAFVQNISVLRESRAWDHVTHMCCYKLERPAGPRCSAIWA